MPRRRVAASEFHRSVIATILFLSKFIRRSLSVTPSANSVCGERRFRQFIEIKKSSKKVPLQFRADSFKFTPIATSHWREPHICIRFPRPHSHSIGRHL
ncbi:hypothetical protein TNIN_251881 [Trichonephila inaurata madagascariensis]|uniref:Uncharacterized protein n=1 Tax=Trichonephila inaurata madagascariensis TaxID=2747483 RepID=A0A8X6WRS1_9ARAC|nr:hypothetical protein TNIN_251881 [Trichonephila inaurata madagascariensis]